MEIISLLAVVLASAVVLSAVLFLIVEVSILLIGHLNGAPFVPSRRERMEQMFALAEIRPKERAVDLGSGDGRVLIEAAQRGAHAVGVEINPFLVWFSRWKIRRGGFGGNATVRWQDFRTYSLEQTDVVFLYLWPQTVERLREKLSRELRPGARIVSNAFPIAGWIPERVEEGVFLYRIAPKG